MTTYEEAELRNRLKREIDRLPSVRLKNISRSKNSFFAWVKRTAQRIWRVITDSWIAEAAKWLWGLIMGL